MTADVDAVLLGGKLPEDTVPVCTRGDLVDEYRRVADELAQARIRATADPRLAGSGTPALDARIEELHGQIEAATVPFRLRALAPRRWRELVEQHPPRKVGGNAVHPDDAGVGVNRETFFPALIRVSTVEPKLRDETWDQLLDPDGELLNVAQFQRLWRTCWDLNKQEPDVPFSLAGLLTTRSSASESGSPAPSASASNGSTGGNRGKSSSTSTKTGD